VDDIISFHGESIPEFEANLHAVVDDSTSRLARALAADRRSPPAANSC